MQRKTRKEKQLQFGIQFEHFFHLLSKLSANERRLKKRKISNTPGKRQGPDRDPEYLRRDEFLLFFVNNAVEKKALITKTMIHLYVKSQCRLHKIPDFSSEEKKR